MSSHTDFLLLLQRKGYALSELGLREVGLEREIALEAIGLLQNASRSILGGDVYFKRNDKIESAYADWHSDPKPNENRDEFVRRSCEEARHYIKHFPREETVPLFVFVVGK